MLDSINFHGGYHALARKKKITSAYAFLSTYPFFYTSCKMVMRSSGRKLLKICEALPARASIQPMMLPTFQRFIGKRLVRVHHVVADHLTGQREAWQISFVMKLQVASGMSVAKGVDVTC